MSLEIHTDENGLEERFRATESFIPDSKDLTVRKFVMFVMSLRANEWYYIIWLHNMGTTPQDINLK